MCVKLSSDLWKLPWGVLVFANFVFLTLNAVLSQFLFQLTSLAKRLWPKESLINFVIARIPGCDNP